MAKFESKLPKMGESVDEATLTAWLIDIGDTIEIDDGVLEIATDKVDTELPSEVTGVLVEKLFNVDDIIKVGQTIAIIETKATDNPSIKLETKAKEEITSNIPPEIIKVEETIKKAENIKQTAFDIGTSERFYSPLVRSIAQKEGISSSELDSIVGSAKGQRLTKNDLLEYLKNHKSSVTQQNLTNPKSSEQSNLTKEKTVKQAPIETAMEDEIIPMDRMGKLIAKHMVNSIQTSAHVQSFIEIDVTRIVNWRKKVKDQFLKEKGEKLTFTPILMHAVAQTIKDYPMVNVSVDGTNIIKRKAINLGMAAALPNGNLIVPVIKNANELNLVAMAKEVNNLATKARNGKLSPDDIQGGTYTVTNVGSFGSITGTPIINQPQVAILALGTIRKMPSVIETPDGDFIGIRHKMIVAHSYDHRVVNGALGGQFILRLKEILENFDSNQTI
jgi:2-oxoglutarate dehydrogenase E2 component (dihydrolipoamide succinyltransferase)